MTEERDSSASSADSRAVNADLVSPATDADVDTALAELSRLEHLPVEDHVAVFDGIHQRLRDRLADAAGQVEDTHPS